MKKEKVTEQKTVVAITEKETAEIKVNVHLDKVNPGDYASMTIPELGALLANPDLNENQQVDVLKAIKAKAEHKEKSEREKAFDLVESAKIQIANVLTNFLSSNGLELAKIKPLVAVTSEGKDKSSHTFFTFEKDFRVNELTARKLSFTLTVSDNISKKAQRSLLKDAAFRIAMREAERKRDEEIARQWNEFSGEVLCSTSYIGEGPKF